MIRYGSLSTLKLCQLLAHYGMSENDIETKKKKEDMIEMVQKLGK